MAHNSYPPDMLFADVAAECLPQDGDLPFHLRPDLQFHEHRDLVHGNLLIRAELHFGGGADRGPDRVWEHEIDLLRPSECEIRRERAEWMEWVKAEAINHGRNMNKMLCDAIMTSHMGLNLLMEGITTDARRQGFPIGHFRGFPIYDTPPPEHRFHGLEIDFQTIDEATEIPDFSTFIIRPGDLVSCIGGGGGGGGGGSAIPVKPDTLETYPIPAFIPRTIQHGPFTAHLLDSNIAVWEEADAMRNCIWRLYREKIKSGDHIAYHVESPANKHGLTLGLDPDYHFEIKPGAVAYVENFGEFVRDNSAYASHPHVTSPMIIKMECAGWKLYQIIGKANSQPKEPEAAQAFAHHVLGKINELWKQHQKKGD